MKWIGQHIWDLTSRFRHSLYLDGTLASTGNQAVTRDQVLVRDSSTGLVSYNDTVGNTYTHDQGIANSVWSMDHNLNKHPSVTVVDSGGTVVVGQVTYLNTNRLTITFKSGFSGKAYLN